MTQASLTESAVPYPVPHPDDTSEGVARAAHREWYWSVHDYDEYTCPDCGRGVEAVARFDVHHKDENPLNGHPNNLVAVCRRCHGWRHGTKSISGLSLDEWKVAFVNPEYEL